MKTKIKRFISVLLSCTVLVFSCIFIPHQKAEAGLLLAGGVALGTAVAIGLIGYGIAVSSDDPAEDEYLGMACDKLTEYAAGQGINKWNLYNYLTNATWFWSAMANVAAWFYEQNLVFNETYEKLFPATALENGLAYSYSITSTEEFVFGTGAAKYMLSLRCSSSSRDFYFFQDSSSDIYIISDYWSNYSAFSFPYVQVNTETSESFIDFLTTDTKYNDFYYENVSAKFLARNFPISASEFFSRLGISFVQVSEGYTVENFIDSLVIGELEPTSPGICVDFPQRLFTSPADVLDITGSMESYKIDSTKDVINPADALELTELKTFDGLRDRLLEGDITADDVLTSVGAQPYVLTDSETGEIATTDTPAERVKPVALEGDLSIPKDLVAEDTYTPTNTSTDTDKPKTRFNFPLSQFFPFCLPFDLYDFLTFFVADPVAPVFEMDLSSMFSADPDIYDPDSDYTITIDLSKFDEVAELLRVLETIGIIVGFVLVSRKLIHGGN